MAVVLVVHVVLLGVLEGDGDPALADQAREGLLDGVDVLLDDVGEDFGGGLGLEVVGAGRRAFIASSGTDETVILLNGVFTACGSASGLATKAETAARSAASVRPWRSRHRSMPRFQAFCKSVSLMFARRPAATFIMSGLLRMATMAESSLLAYVVVIGD